VGHVDDGGAARSYIACASRSRAWGRRHGQSELWLAGPVASKTVPEHRTSIPIDAIVAEALLMARKAHRHWGARKILALLGKSQPSSRCRRQAR